MKTLFFPKPKLDPLRPFPEKLPRKNERLDITKPVTIACAPREGESCYDIHVAESVHCVVSFEQTFSDTQFARIRINAAVGRDASLVLRHDVRGGSRIDTEVAVELAEEGSEGLVQARVHGVDEQHHGFFSIMRHCAPNTKGDIQLRGVFEHASRGLFSGLIRIEPAADKANSYFKDDVLLCDNALAESLPTLEIEANDVKASHGSTTAHMNEDQLFYLQSRGLPRREARAMIIEGFLLQ